MTDHDNTEDDASPAQEIAGDAYQTAMQKRLRRKKRINTIAVAITSGIVLCCIFWLTAFTFFNIGSNSMAPTLVGGPEARDRILCWKLSYLFRGPKRWEIAIFNTPSSAANQEIMPGFHTGGESGLTIKRIVGLPNEKLAMAGGDIWTKPLSGGDEFQRQVKPDAVQERIWIKVYEEDFSDVRTPEELGIWWDTDGEGEVAVAPGRPLRLTPGDDHIGIHYRPLVRRGVGGDRMILLPGIPDRYVLQQSLLFTCPNPECGNDFSVEVDSQKIMGRCPVCGQIALETAVDFYEFRSGLPEIGSYSVGFRAPSQGDDQHFRADTYNFVPDLRVTFEMRLAGADTTCEIEVSGDGREAHADIGGDGRVRVAAIETKGVHVKPGEWIRVEFYRVDGAVRLFLGPDRKPVFDRVMWPGDMPAPDFLGENNGVALRARGGAVEFRNIRIDRDIHYFSGKRYGWRNYLNAMDVNAMIDIGKGAFFPLGDNTTVSLDARSWGPVNTDNLRGTALMIVRPKERSGWIDD